MFCGFTAQDFGGQGRGCQARPDVHYPPKQIRIHISNYYMSHHQRLKAGGIIGGDSDISVFYENTAGWVGV